MPSQKELNWRLTPYFPWCLGVLAAVLFIPQKVVGGSEYCVSCGGSCIEAALTVQLDINVQELAPLALPIALGEELQLQLPMGELEMYQKSKKNKLFLSRLYFLRHLISSEIFYENCSFGNPLSHPHSSLFHGGEIICGDRSSAFVYFWQSFWRAGAGVGR